MKKWLQHNKNIFLFLFFLLKSYITHFCLCFWFQKFSFISKQVRLCVCGKGKGGNEHSSVGTIGKHHSRPIFYNYSNQTYRFAIYLVYIPVFSHQVVPSSVYELPSLPHLGLSSRFAAQIKELPNMKFLSLPINQLSIGRSSKEFHSQISWASSTEWDTMFPAITRNTFLFILSLQLL